MYSESLVPRPQEWSHRDVNVGAWRATLSTSTLGASRLSRPIVLVSLGSLDPPRATSLYKALDSAVRELKGTLLLRHGVPLFDRDRVQHIEHSQFGSYLSLSDAVVHHGGAGTTASAMRAGVPQVVAPFFYDQFFWADRVQRAGLGPPALCPINLSTSSVLERLEIALDSHMAHTVRAMADAVRSEHGQYVAAAAIEKELFENDIPS